jgi:hypothetical protein
MLLQKGGRCVYFGDIGANSRTIIDYFETKGAIKCAEKANPAECKLIYNQVPLEVPKTTDRFQNRHLASPRSSVWTI